MHIQGGRIVKDVDLEMFFIDGYFDEVINEFERGLNVCYCIYKNDKPVAMIVPLGTPEENREILQNQIEALM